MEPGTDRLIEEVSAGRRSSFLALYQLLFEWWESRSDELDPALDELAQRSITEPKDGLARELLLTVVHQFGLSRPAIARLTVEPHVMEEVAQAALFSVERSLDTFAGRSTFRTWLYTIARNETLTYFRRQQRHDQMSGGLGPEDGVADPKVGRLSSSVTTRTTVRHAIEELPEPYRQTLYLRFFGQMAYQEIATEISVPVGTVRSRMAKGRELLSESLGL